MTHLSTDKNVSDILCNQTLGHSDAKIRQRHYFSASVRLDVQSIFLGSADRTSIIKSLACLGLRNNPPHRSSVKADDVNALPEIQAAAHKREAAINVYGKEHPICQELGRTLHNLKALKRRELFRERLNNFHQLDDLHRISAQLNGDDLPVEPREIVEHNLEERDLLALDLSDPIPDNSTFARIVNCMTRLCSRYETTAHRRIYKQKTQMPLTDATVGTMTA